MVCYSPLEGWRSKRVNPETGKRSIVFNQSDGYSDMPITIACGQCIGCRLDRSRSWAVRCMHEASLYENNCFITLTLSPEYLDYRNRDLPEKYIEFNNYETGEVEKKLMEPDSLRVEDFQLFMKRLRKKFGEGIRYFHCGEYGEQKGRPHYHACIFNFDFPDKKCVGLTKTGHPNYQSDILSEKWKFGLHQIGSLTWDSAAYVARYIMKKNLGKGAEELYYWYGKRPEYTTMSRRPGIAHDWFKKYYTDVYSQDFVVLPQNRKCKVPKYYDNLYELTYPEDYKIIKTKRRIFSETFDFEKQRLYQKRLAKEALLKKLERTLHFDDNLSKKHMNAMYKSVCTLRSQLEE